MFREKYFPEHVQEQKEREFTELVQSALSVAEYETKFSVLEKYALHIFDNTRRKLKKFMDGLRSNIPRFVATNDLKTFTKALRVAHLTERENDRFVEE